MKYPTKILNGLDITPRPVLDDVTVLIPTLGRTMLEGCLYSIATGKAWPAHLIVVDQSSSPRVGSWIEKLKSIGLFAEHVRSSQKGVAAATNRGIERAKTRFLALTHDDCKVETDWLILMHSCLLRNSGAVITGRVEPGGSGVIVSIKTSTIHKIYRRPLLVEDVLYPNNMGCERGIFSKVGFFDEGDYLRSAEDNDWSYRALRAGVPIIYAPEVIVTHLDWRNKAQLIAAYKAYALSQGGFYGKHLRGGDMFITLRIVIGLVRGFHRWLLGIISHDSHMLASGWISMTKMPSGIIAGLRGRK